MGIFVKLIIISLCKIIYETNAKATLSIRIFNYKNDDNLKHDGGKCEKFHWINDHCDPMFKICVTAKNPCDILNKKIDPWKNKKRLFTVLTQIIELNKVERSISVIVQVDDHDKFQAPEHIAIFSANFQLNNLNNPYQKTMEVKPKNLNVGLQTSLLIKCAQFYYGENCDKITCDSKCGHGICLLNNQRDQFYCKCDDGWSGINCGIFKTNNCSLLNCKKKCRNTDFGYECVCVPTGNYLMSCRQIISTKFALTKQITSRGTTSVVSKMSENIQTRLTTGISVALDKTNKLPESLKLSENNKAETVYKPIKENLIAVSQTPSTIVIICLLLLLCVYIISLSVILRSWQNRNRMCTMMSPYNQRPLPPILFQRNIKPKESFKSYVQENSAASKKETLSYETCTIPYTYSKNKSNKYFVTNYEIENIDPYEEPIINNMESLTCETECIDSDESDAYEIPNKY